MKEKYEPAPVECASNEPLLGVQRREIELSIQALQKDKHRIDADVERTHMVLEDLHFQKHEKDLQIQRLKGMISPLKSFPSELLSKIFEEYAVQLEEAPWLLGHICSRWRAIALKTPKAWRKIVVRLRDYFPTYSNFEKEKTLFDRGAQALISCTLILKRPGVPSIFYFLKDFLQYSNRLCELSLDSVDSFLPLLKLSNVNLSSLEKLTLKFYPQTRRDIPAITQAGQEPGYSAITFFENSPLLRRVNIDTDSFDRWMDPNILPLQLPWYQLTQLLLSPHLTIHYDPLSAVLRLCKNLSRCRFPIPMGGPGITQPPPVMLQNLGVLELVHGYIAEMERATQVIPYLILPSLKRLILTSHNGKAVAWPLRSLTELISRSKCNIEVFHARSSLGKDSTLALLNGMPSVTEVLIQGIDILPRILGRMAHEDFLSNLSYIDCRAYHIFDNTPDKIIKALGENGFMEAPSDAGVSLHVRILTNGETSIESSLDNLSRNWLAFGFEKAGQLYETEYELFEL